MRKKNLYERSHFERCMRRYRIMLRNGGSKKHIKARYKRAHLRLMIKSCRAADNYEKLHKKPFVLSIPAPRCYDCLNSGLTYGKTGVHCVCLLGKKEQYDCLTEGHRRRIDIDF